MSKPTLDLTALRQAYEEERQGQRNRSVEWWLNHIRALLDALEQAQRELAQVGDALIPEGHNPEQDRSLLVEHVSEVVQNMGEAEARIANSYVKNCLIKYRENETCPLFNGLDPSLHVYDLHGQEVTQTIGEYVVRLDGYAIVPRDEWEQAEARITQLERELAEAQAERDRAQTALREAFRAGFNAHPDDDDRSQWDFTDGVAADLEPDAWQQWAALTPTAPSKS